MKEAGVGHYNKIYTEYGKDFHNRKYGKLYDLFMADVKKSKGVLELGCGTGALGERMCEARILYRGFDFSPVAIKLAQKSEFPYAFFLGDIYEVESYLPHNYDTVVASEVLEHVDDLRVISYLPPDLRLLFSIPDFMCAGHLRCFPDADAIRKRYAKVLDIEQISPIILKAGEISDRDATIFYVEAMTKVNT